MDADTAMEILASPFRALHASAANVLPMFSPARLFAKPAEGEENKGVLDDATKRKVQMTKGGPFPFLAHYPWILGLFLTIIRALAFTQLRSDINSDDQRAVRTTHKVRPTALSRADILVNCCTSCRLGSSSRSRRPSRQRG